MLKPVSPSVVSAKDAAGPGLFPSRLEFNAPAHGVWNIVHIGMLVPQAHQIYICAINCMRGVVLTAAEMNAADRFSCVVLREEDVVAGTVEEVTLRGVIDVLEKLPALPPCVLVFPVCTHHFLGIDLGRVYAALEARFPQVTFVRCFMDPIMQKQGLPADQRLRRSMYDPLPPGPANGAVASLLGCDFPLEPDADLRGLLSGHGLALRELPGCQTYDDYLALGQAETILAVFPGGAYGAAQTAKRLGRRYLYLPMSFDYGQIAASWQAAAEHFGFPLPELSSEIAACDQALAEARRVIGSAAIAIDATVHPRPLELAKLLLEHGFRVTEVYLDAVNGEEQAALAWLRENAPELALSSTILPDRRVASRSRSEPFLAIGQKAAWFTGTSHFVNLVQGSGLWGFAGVRAMARYMVQAWQTEQDPEDLIPRKGLGCESCI